LWLVHRLRSSAGTLALGRKPRLGHWLRVATTGSLGLRGKLRLVLRLQVAVTGTLALGRKLRLVSLLRVAVTGTLALGRKLRLVSLFWVAVTGTLALGRKLRLVPLLRVAMTATLTLGRKLRLVPFLWAATPGALALRRKLRLRRTVPQTTRIGLGVPWHVAPCVARRNGLRRIFLAMFGVPRIRMFVADDDRLPAPVIEIEKIRPLLCASPCAVEKVVIVTRVDVVVDHHIRIVIILIIGWRIRCGHVYSSRAVIMTV